MIFGSGSGSGDNPIGVYDSIHLLNFCLEDYFTDGKLYQRIS